MIWYQYIFLALAVVCYSIKELQIFGKLRWRHSFNDLGFWNQGSWKRKYLNTDREPRFFGSTTFLVWLTDGFHLMQMIMKICFSLGIFGITWWALVGFICWTGIQWGCFKLFSK